jgi:hypothetical protein
MKPRTITNVASGVSALCWALVACVAPTLEHGCMAITAACLTICIWGREQQ